MVQQWFLPGSTFIHSFAKGAASDRLGPLLSHHSAQDLSGFWNDHANSIYMWVVVPAPLKFRSTEGKMTDKRVEGHIKGNRARKTWRHVHDGWSKSVTF